MLLLQATALRTARRLRGTTDAGWHDSLTDESGEPLPRRDAVVSLRTVLSGTDRDHGAGESRRESIDHTSTLHIAQSSRRCKIQTELHARIRGVDPLPAGPRRARELFDQLARRDRESAGSARSRRHTQIIHPTSVPQRGERHLAPGGRIV